MSKILTPSFSDLTGFLLIASPLLAESFFAQSVVYISEYSKKEGAFGVVINKRISHVTLDDDVRGKGSAFIDAMPQQFLGAGGPINREQVYILHTPLPDELSLSGIQGPARLSADLEMFYELSEDSNLEYAFAVLGHAGWAPGQLETEIMDHHYWLIAPATKKLVFETDSHRIWEEALASLGMVPAFLSNEKGEG